MFKHFRKRRAEKRRRKFLFFIGVFLIFLIFFFSAEKISGKISRFLLERQKSEIAKIVPQKPKKIILKTEKKLSPTENFLKNLPKKFPEKMMLDVFFVCQNPFQNAAGWKFHKESCEEAAALQNVLFWRGETISPENADRKIREMIAFQEKKFGEHRDLYGEDFRVFVRDFFGFADDEVLFFPKIDKIFLKRSIAAGFPVIVPVRSKLLKNPFYPYPGYHMLSVIGFSGDTIITNDVGTKRGEKYPYPADRFLRANAAAGGGGFVLAPKK